MAAIELVKTPLYTDADLISYYRLESNFTDSKSAYNLSASGTPSDVTGKFGNGKSFDGSTSASVSAASSANMPRSILSNLSWSFWIYPNATPNTQKGILGYANSGTDFYCCHFDNTSQKVAFVVNTGGQGGRAAISTTALSASTWYHIVAINDYTNTKLKIWVNGSKEHEITSSLASGTNTAAFEIGAINGIGNANIILDDIAVFDRALTDQEVSNLYNGTWATASFLLNFL